VAIDWEEIGPGPVGAEAATLVFGTLRRGAVPVQQAEELERTALLAYQRGLRDAGWNGDPRLVRLGYAAAVALRWFIVPGTLHVLVDRPGSPAASATRREAATNVVGTVGGQAQAGAQREAAPPRVSERLALLRFLLARAGEARALADQVGDAG
jgi:hypothetical protein